MDFFLLWFSFQVQKPLNVNTVGQAAIQAILQRASEGVYDCEGIAQLAQHAARAWGPLGFIHFYHSW